MFSDCSRVRVCPPVNSRLTYIPMMKAAARRARTGASLPPIRA
jgi:hypothetical protein